MVLGWLFSAVTTYAFKPNGVACIIACVVKMKVYFLARVGVGKGLRMIEVMRK